MRRDVKDRRIGHHLMLVEKRRKPTPVLHQGAELKTVRGRRDRIERAITAKRAPASAGTDDANLCTSVCYAAF